MPMVANPPELLFWPKVDTSGECWLWTGSLGAGGYGRWSTRGRGVAAHRWAYEQMVGPIPVGLQLDHLCRVRNCVNPDHLEPVTPRENTRRGLAGQINRSKTHCPHGHQYSENNTYHRTDFDGTARVCRRCAYIAQAKWRRKLKETS